MELWDQDFIDLVVPGYVEFGPDGNAAFQFGCVFGGFTWPRGASAMDADWVGNDEMDPACGVIDAQIDGSRLTGMISFDAGDQSDFEARRWRPSDVERS